MAEPNETSAPVASERPRGLVYRAPDDSENVPPKLANFVSVSGATDALVLEFFYASQTSQLRAYRGDFGGSVSAGPDGTAVLTSEPVARVAVPVSVALDMIVDMVRVAVEEAPGIKSRFEAAIAEVQAVVAASPIMGKQG